MEHRFSGLWHHPDFMKLWLGQTVSEFGSRITREGLPLTAVIVLGATPAKVGLLIACAALPSLMLGLLAGAWVDRLRRRPIMLAMDTGRAIVLLTIPIAALTGHLSLGLVYSVTVLSSTMTLFFGVAYHAVLPSLVELENVFEGNSKLATSESLAEIGGPPLAGVLIQAISAPLAIFFDALSFLLSAVSLMLINKPEPPPAPRRDNASVWREIVEGLHVIAANSVLRTVAVGMGVRAFFGNFFGTLYTLFAIRDLGLTPGVLGVLVGAGGVGALIGSALAPRLVQHFGLGHTLTGALLCSAIINWLIPLAGISPLVSVPLVTASMLIVGQLIGDGAMVVYAVNELSLRQIAVPDRLLGRVNASMDFLAQGVAPVGAVVAGLLAEPTALGTRSTLFIAVLGILAISLWMLRSPIRRLHSFDDFVLDGSDSLPTSQESSMTL